MLDLTGQKLGGYELAALLGKSGIAEEYQAHRTGSAQDVVVTVFHGCRVDDPVFLDHFREEARRAAALRHPAIAPVVGFDVAIAGGEALPYLVTEWTGDRTLKQRLADLSSAGQFMPWTEVLAIVKAIGGALDYAHALGIVHQDVKPAYIRLRAGGDAVLTGFAVASLAGSTLQALSDGITGSPAYAAPELGRGDPVDGRADLYSLGVVLFELCTNRLPFASDSAAGMMLRHATEPPLVPSQANPALSAAVEKVILRALAKPPDERFQSAAELTQALQTAVGIEPASTAVTPAAGVQGPALVAATAAPEGGGPGVDELLTGDARRALHQVKRAIQNGGLRNFLVGAMAVVTTTLAVLEKFFKAIDLLRNPLIGLAVVVVGLGTVAVSAGYVLARPKLYGPAHRRLAMAGLAVTVTAALVWGGWTIVDLVRPPKGLVVLIADFEQAPGARTVDYPRRIEAGINESLQKLKVDGIFVERANEVYSEKDARARAAAKKAAVIIYGWYDDAGVNPRFELVKAPQQYLPIVKQSAVELASLDRLELRVDRELKEMNYIAAATIGMSYYADGQNRQAITFFDLALRNVLTDTRLLGRESVDFYKASSLVFLNDYPSAVSALQEAVRLKPDFAEAHRNLAIVYNATCNPTGAEREAAEALRLKPDSAASLQLMGLMQGRAGRWAEAAQSYEAALSYGSDDPSVHAALGEALANAGRSEEGRAELAKSATLAADRLRARPNDPQTMGTHADALYAQGRLEEAAAEYEQAIGRAESQGVQVSRVAWLQRSLGLTRWGQQHWPEMMVAYTRAISLSPGLYTDAVAMGVAAQASGEPEEALGWYRKALALMPCDANTRSLLAALLEKQGRQDKALTEYTEAARLDPADPVVWHSIAMILEAKGNESEASVALGKAADAAQERLKQDPRDGNVAYLLGAVYFELEDYVHAVGAFQKAVALVPDVAGHSALGHSYYQTRQYGLALAEYTAALALDTNDWASLTGQAETLDRLNRPEEAVAAYHKALAVKDDAEVRYSLGSLLYRQGKYYDAATELEASLALKDDAQVRASFAAVFGHIGNPDRSITEYMSSLRLNERPETHVSLALVLEQQDRLAEAADHYRAATALFPADGPYRDNSRVSLASVLARMCRMDEAMAALQPSLGPGPSGPVGVLGMVAYLHEAQGRPQEAGQVYSTLLATSGTLPGVHYLAGGFAYRQGRTADAIKEMVEATRLAPAYSAAWVALGGLYAAQRDYAAAGSAYDLALKAMPANVNALLGLAALDLERNDPAAALPHFESTRKNMFEYLLAVPDETDSAGFALELYEAFANERLGKQALAGMNYAEALRLATSAARALPNQPQALFQLGIALWATGDQQKSASAFAEAARCDASLGVEQTRAMERLRRLRGR